MTDRDLLDLFGALRAAGRSSGDAIERIELFLPDEEISTCSWRGVPALTVEGHTTGDGDWICSEAYENDGFTCSVCGDIYHTDRSNALDGEQYICDHCARNGSYTYVSDRGCYVHDDDLPDEDDDEEDDGSSISFVTSVDIFDTNPIPPPRAPQPDPEEDHRLIRNYSRNPLEILDGFRYADDESLPLSPMWLGVELEVEPRGSTSDTRYIRATHEATKHFAILKSDGSVGAGGFEIVTVPCTLGYHRQAWGRFFDEAAGLLRSWTTTEGRDGARCGMHVHIARSALSDLQLGKMLVFINDEGNRPFIEDVAGRSSNSYTQFHRKRVSDAMRRGRDRYEALNTATGKPTVELRIFRGNVAKAGFFKNLEFTDAFARFCGETSPRAIGAKDFAAWVRSRDHAYPVLTEWLIRKGYLAPAPRRPVRAEAPAYAG